MRPPANARPNAHTATYTPIDQDDTADPPGDDGDIHSDVGSDGVTTPLLDQQPGVQNAEAMTQTWTLSSLVFTYIMIWIIYFVEGLLLGSTAVLNPYVTSDFSRHSLTPTVGIVSSVVGGVTNLTLAKVLDVFGRPQGYLVCIGMATCGLIMMTLCKGVESYAVAQILQTIGNNGILYALAVVVADTSSLRNRGLMLSLVTSPNLITCWIVGPMSSWFLDGPGWRWAFGLFTVLVPLVTLPLFYILLKIHRQAKKQHLTAGADVDPRTTFIQGLRYYLRHFDAIGLFLLSAGVALFLLPFNIYESQPFLFVLGSLSLGIILILIFILWEKRYATITFIPYSLLTDRTVLGACTLSSVVFISFWCWNSYFSSYLQVVNDLSVENASYVVQIYTVCSVLCAIAVGVLIHRIGRFKPACLYFGVPFSIIGSVLMMYSCTLGSDTMWIVMCQILLSIAAGTIVVCDEVAILAAATHQHVAVCLSVLALFGNIGGAIGLTAASTIWQEVFPSRLEIYLPPEELPNMSKIYANLSTQLSYPVGSETRIAIQHAYVDAQTRMLTAGTLIWVVGFVAVLVWRDINVIEIKQNKGQVW